MEHVWGLKQSMGVYIPSMGILSMGSDTEHVGMSDTSLEHAV